MQRFELDLIATLGCAGRRRSRRKLERDARAEHHRRHSPWLQLSIDFEDLAAAIEEDDIDRKAHEEHVHPHHRSEAAVVEPHAGARLKTVATEQAAALTAETARILETLLERLRTDGPDGGLSLS